MEIDRKEAFELLLSELEAEREKLDAQINVIRERLGKSSGDNSGESASPKGARGATIHPDTFYGMSVIEGAKKYLGMVGRPGRTTKEIIEALKKGGLDKDYTTVSSVLSRAARQDELGNPNRGMWGLKEWYPGTGRRASRNNEDKEGNPEEIAKGEEQ